MRKDSVIMPWMVSKQESTDNQLWQKQNKRMEEWLRLLLCGYLSVI